MSVIDEPGASGSSAKLDAYPDQRLERADHKAPERPVVCAPSRVCPGCGCPIPADGPDAPVGMTRAQLIRAGRTACLCKRCGFPLRRWKRRRRYAPTCRDCGREVPEADDAADSVTCDLCLLHRAELRRLGLLRKTDPDRTCPDCGMDRPKHTRRCTRCATRRRRAKARERQRRRRTTRTV